MKIGKRLLAMLLVLAMLVSNLPVGALAAEFEELTAPTEAVIETEQPTEATVEETEAPETTAAPAEPVEETTAAAEEPVLTVEDPVTAAEEPAMEAETVRFNFYVFLGTMDGAEPGKHWFTGEEDVMVWSMDVPVGTTVDMADYVPYCYDYTFRGWFMDPYAQEENNRKETFTVTEDHLAANEETAANGLYGLHFTSGWEAPEDSERTMVYFDNSGSGWETVACVGLTADDQAHNITISTRGEPDLYYVPLPDEIVKVYFQNASFLMGEEPTAVTEIFDVEAEKVYTYEEVAVKPASFHFTTTPSTDDSNTDLIYELNADDLQGATDSMIFYAAMFGNDCVWSNVRLAGNSDSFADIEQESDDLYKITLYGEARKYVADDGYVNLEITSTQTNINTGEVNENGYMSLPIFLAPNPGLIVANLSEDGDWLFYESEYHSYMYRIVPGNVMYQMYYLRQWDYSQGKMVETPVPVDELRGDYLVFTQLSPDWIREDEPNAEFFTEVRATEWGHATSVYIERDGRTISGVNAYTDMGGVGYFSAPEMREENYLLKYYVNPDGENVLYFILNEDYAWEPFDIDVPPVLKESGGAAWATMEDLGNNIYKITLSQGVVDTILQGYEYNLCVEYTSTSRSTGFTNVWPIGITLLAHEEDIVHPPILSYGFVMRDENDENWIEAEEFGYNTGFSITPGDRHFQVYYLQTWDAEEGCYVEQPDPVPVSSLRCDNEAIEITGLDGSEYFADIACLDWGGSTEIYAVLEDGTVTTGVHVSIRVPDLAYYYRPEVSPENMIYRFFADPNAEENAFYVGLYTDHFIPEYFEAGVPNVESDQVELEWVSDTVYKVILTEQGMADLQENDEIWVTVKWDFTYDGSSNTISDSIGIRLADGAQGSAEEGLRFRFLENWGEGFFDTGNADRNETGTNIAKGDVYSMVFFLNFWDEEQGQFVEIPVHPEFDEGIFMNRIDYIQDGAENSEYYYHVSVADEALDSELEIWVDYEGERYTMNIWSYLHEFAAYSTEEPSHDTRLMEPMDLEPFGENAAYLVYLGEGWSLEDVWVDDEVASYVDLEPVQGKDNVWKLALTEDGINRNLNYWVLDMNVYATIRNDDDSDWTQERQAHVAFTRENLETYAFFRLETGDYEVVDGGYLHSWPTGEYDSDDQGNTWEIWETEAVENLPDGLSYDWTTNTFTMDGYSGEWMDLNYSWYDGDEDTYYYDLPSDTVTIELHGDNSLITENNPAFQANGELNVVITGDGELYARTTNDMFVDYDGHYRTVDTWTMHGGDLTVEGDVSVTIEVDGEGNETIWDENDNTFVRPGSLSVLAMNMGNLYLKDNARLETVIPDGMGRNGSEDVGEENALWGERFPGGANGITGFSLLSVSGGTLKTQTLTCDWGMWEDNSVWNGHYIQTGGEVFIQASGSNHVLDEGGYHAHYEGLVVLRGSSAYVSGGTLSVQAEVSDEHKEISHWCEPITVRGGSLTITGDAEVNVTANTENCNLVNVCNDEDKVGRLDISGGTLNVNGSEGEGNGCGGIYLDFDTVFEMSDGIINSRYADFMNHGPAHITGGTINIGGQYLYDDPERAWVTGFNAGGPEFIIDGGEINVVDGHFIAGGMVTMNNGIINITNGSLEVGNGFHFNDGQITIENDETELTKQDHYWASLWIGGYMSIGGQSENADPTLTIDHDIWTSAVIVPGTYHQMGGTVDVTHYGEVIDGVKNNAIYVKTEFDENGHPVVATDEEGNPILDENGNEVFISGSFLMNDGVLNVRNAGDYEADLIIGMQADPYTFVQFLGGDATFVTAMVHWDGEAHIGGDALVELKDAALFTNAGHFYMDGGTLKANDESAVCLGMSEMDGGRMDLANAQIIVRGGFHFNNGEIIIDNTAADIDPNAIWASLSVDTYFAIGNPEDPDSNPRLIINHNLETYEAVQILGTMHQMAGTVEINVSESQANAMHLHGIVIDENTGEPFRVDVNGNPMGGEFLKNGGVLNINVDSTEQKYDVNGGRIWHFGVYAEEDSAFYMDGGAFNVEAVNVNGAFVTWGDFNQVDGTMNLSVIDESGTYEGENAIETNGPTSITGGTMNLVSTDTGYANNNIEELAGGSRVNISGGTINIEVPRLGMFLCSSTTISGGEVNIGLSNYYQDIYGEGDVFEGTLRYAQGIFPYGVDNPDMVLNVTGGKINIVIDQPDRETEFTEVQAIVMSKASANLTGGVILTSGGPVVVNSIDENDYLNLEDMVVYSRTTGNQLEQLYYTREVPEGTVYISSFEEDNVANDLTDFAAEDWADDLVIVSTKAGANVTWEAKDGLLTFQNNGGMFDFSPENPAPWYWIRDFITSAEMDTNLGTIGSHAFWGMEKLNKLFFLGQAPKFAADAFAGLVADAYYPPNVKSWTAAVLQSYGGEVIWTVDKSTVEVVDIWTEKDHLIAGEKTTLNAELYPERDVVTTVVWTLAEGDENYATLAVKNNVATVTAKQVTEKHTITVYAKTKDGLALPLEKTLTLYPKAQSVSIFWDGEDVTGSTVKVDQNSTLNLTASLNPADVEEYLESAVTWTTSSAAIATVEEGIVTIGEKTGTVKITATANDGSKKKALVTITVLNMIDGIEVDAVEEIVGGKTATFVAKDENGTKLKSSQVTWSIPEEFAAYATITTAGKLSTKVVQEAVTVKATATYVDNPATFCDHSFTIYPAATVLQLEALVDGISTNVTGKTLPISLDDPSIQLNPVSYPNDALTSVTWKTSSKGIATVEDGLVSGTGKAGTVTITATDANSKKSASVKLTFGVFAELVQIDRTNLEFLDDGSVSILSGASMTLKATTEPAEGVTKAGVTWALKNATDKNYLTVTTSGVAKAKTVYAPTKVTLVASSKDGYAEPDEITLTVMPKDMGMLAIKSGDEYVTNLTKTVNFNAANTLELTAVTLGTEEEETVKWSSSATSVATVDAEGVVTFLKAGTAKITATHEDGRKAVVTLKAAKLATGITIKDKSSGKTGDLELALAAGKSLTLAITAEGVSKAAVTWSVDDSSLATITSGGKLTASASVTEESIVTVTARANDGSGVEDTIEVIVRPQIQGIQIWSVENADDDDVTVEVTNRTMTFDVADGSILVKAKTFPEDKANVTWKSSNTKIADYDPETGRIEFYKAGSVTITVTANDGSGKKATFTLTLVQKVTSLTLDKTEAILAGGKSLTLKATVDAGATNKGVTWSMTGDTAYVTLSAKGVLKASAVTGPKTVYVTATANDGSGKTATCEVTIYPATTAVQIWHDGQLTKTTTTLKVKVGETIDLEAVSVPGTAAEIYEWKSSGAAATVDNGKVTGVTANKTVTITCTALDGTGKKTTVKVNVIPAE